MAPFSDKGTLLRSFYNSKSVYDALSFATVGSSAVSAVIAKESDSVIAATFKVVIHQKRNHFFKRPGCISERDYLESVLVLTVPIKSRFTAIFRPADKPSPKIGRSRCLTFAAESLSQLSACKR